MPIRPGQSFDFVGTQQGPIDLAIPPTLAVAQSVEVLTPVYGGEGLIAAVMYFDITNASGVLDLDCTLQVAVYNASGNLEFFSLHGLAPVIGNIDDFIGVGETNPVVGGGTYAEHAWSLSHVPSIFRWRWIQNDAETFDIRASVHLIRR